MYVLLLLLLLLLLLFSCLFDYLLLFVADLYTFAYVRLMTCCGDLFCKPYLLLLPRKELGSHNLDSSLCLRETMEGRQTLVVLCFSREATVLLYIHDILYGSEAVEA